MGLAQRHSVRLTEQYYQMYLLRSLELTIASTNACRPKSALSLKLRFKLDDAQSHSYPEWFMILETTNEVFSVFNPCYLKYECFRIFFDRRFLADEGLGYWNTEITSQSSQLPS